jgi:hypothetical protein
MKPLSLTHPDLIKEWHPYKNPKPIESVSAGNSTDKIWWICPKSHEWTSTIYNRTRKNGSNCPYCSHRRLYHDGSNSLAVELPELAKLWHPTKNGDLRPIQVVAGGEKKYFWKCPNGNDHEWQSSIHGILSTTKRFKGNGCPVCSGIKVVKSNCLATLYSEISKEWIECISHPNKTPETVSRSSNVIVRWQCRIDGRHIWTAKLGNRTITGDGCPMCSGKLNKSEPELIILFELKSIFHRINPSDGAIPRSLKTYNTKQTWPVDIIIPFKGKHLVIEYDGEYAHKNKYKDNDLIKTLELKSLGYNVVRLREGSLPLLDYDWDIPFPKISRNLISRRLELKNVTNQVLRKILEKYDNSMTKFELAAIDDYIKQKDLVNIDRKDKFVYELLREKSEKKRQLIQNRKTIQPFHKARLFARSLRLKRISHWRLYVRGKYPASPKKPNDIPSYPERVYRDLGWIDFNDWLGIQKNVPMDFVIAKDWINNLGLKGERDWRKYLKGGYPDKPQLPFNIPRTPYKVYKNQWKGIRDWLGNIP